MGESFFVLSLSAYVHLSCDFTNTLCNSPPPRGGSVGGDLMECIKSTSDTLTMMDKFDLNFIIHCMLAVITSFYFSKGYFNQRVDTDMRTTLNVNPAVVVGGLTGAILYEWSCVSHYGNIMLLVSFCIFVLVTFYPYFSGIASAGVGITKAVEGAPRFVTLCMDLDPVAAAVGMWGVLVGLVFSIATIVFYERICGVDRTSNLKLQKE